MQPVAYKKNKKTFINEKKNLYSFLYITTEFDSCHTQIFLPDLAINNFLAVVFL